MNNSPTDQGYIRRFIESVYPEAPDLALASFSERQCLVDATGLIHDLRREVAELREDAERYRWLRHENERHCDEEQPCVMLHAQNDWGNWVWLAIDDGEHMDATIDKARSECHAQGGTPNERSSEGTNRRTD